MILIPDLLATDDTVTRGPTVATIGVFDGVHLGHRHLIERAVARSVERSARTLAVVFHPRPREILRPELPPDYLMPLDERLNFVGDLGCDIVGRLRFDTQTAAMAADEFAKVLVQRYGLTELVVGPDFALGRGRDGTVPRLRLIGEQLGFSVMAVDPFLLEGQRVSSTAIRAALALGDVSGAASLLGRGFAITGEVVAGFQRGRTIGLPTANVGLEPKLAVPSNGVYAVRATTSQVDSFGTPMAGVANIGNRPTFDGGARTLEVHLLDYSGDLYGQRLRVEFVERLRPEQRFSGSAAFVEQVGRDIERARLILSRSSENCACGEVPE